MRWQEVASGAAEGSRQTRRWLVPTLVWNAKLSGFRGVEKRARLLDILRCNEDLDRSEPISVSP